MQRLTRSLQISFLVIAMFVFGSNGDFCIADAQETKPSQNDTPPKVAFSIDFTDYREGSIESWLRAKGFEFKLGANNRRAREFRIDDKGLIVKIKRPAIGYLLNDSVDLEKFSKVRIEWGVIEYSEGASYERNINNEPAMLTIFFGYERISSGHFAIPKAPYFIGFYLGEKRRS
jgi:hypothetical protein